MNGKIDTKLSSFLTDIAPYVVVVGSFARKQETELSDIDCYLRNRPVDEVDPELGNETYMPEILDIIDKHGFSDYCDSVIVGHIAVESTSGLSRMVEIASYYKIPHWETVFYREIEGVLMMCAQDHKDTLSEECYDNVDWDDAVEDMAIKFPLPSFQPPVSVWYDKQAIQKKHKVVVKLYNNNGTFKESCIIPSVRYPLDDRNSMNELYEVFTNENTLMIEDKKLLDIFDSVKYEIGHCYQNTDALVEKLKKAGYDAKAYVGWLFLSGASYPIHHCWAVVNNHVLDLADDFSVKFNENNLKHFEGKSIDEQRLLLADFHKEAEKHPNSVRCAPVGKITRPLFYVGCECEPNKGRAIYRKLISTFPDHPVHKNVGKDNLNQTQRVLKKEGLM